MTTRSVNLALQGGGAHGAFTWGVLDRLLEDEQIVIEGITATSAGAMNAAALKSGWLRGRHAGARAELDTFWDALTALTTPPTESLQQWLSAVTPAPAILSMLVQMSPAYQAGEAMTRILSPYEFNPLNIHPLRGLVEDFFDYDAVCAQDGPKLFVSATNVRTGKIRIFSGTDITPDALLASACLPTIYQAVEIEDPDTGRTEAYWDGGYMGNPALFPLFYETACSDIVIVHINPIEREKVPRTATEILNRVNEISFNSSLLRELRSIDFVHRLLADGHVTRGTMKDILIHSIMDDDLMNQLTAVTKMTPDRTLLLQLKAAGRARMDGFLRDHRDDIGIRSTVDLRAMFA